jgi:hypothetical protein
MKNLCYFCHYHRGKPKDVAIKIVGSIIILTMVTVWAASSKVGAAASEDANYLAQLLPEPVFRVSDEGPLQDGGGDGNQPSQNEKKGDESGRGSEGDGGESPFPTAPNTEQKPPTGDGGEQDEDAEEQRRMEFERKNACRDMKNIQRDLKRQKRELTRLCKKLQTLKGSSDDQQSCQDLLSQIGTFEQNFAVCRQDLDPEEIRDSMQEFWDMEIWNQIQVIRNKVEFPREHNRIVKEMTRMSRLLNSRTWEKNGFDTSTLKQRIEEWRKLLEEAKSCYSNGDFECAQEILQEFYENHPGECTGALYNLRNLYQQSRSIRNKELRQEIIELFGGATGMLRDGECRDARIEFEEIYKNLGPEFWDYLSRQERSGLSEEVKEKIRALQEKFGSGGDESEEEEENEEDSSL